MVPIPPGTLVGAKASALAGGVEASNRNRRLHDYASSTLVATSASAAFRVPDTSLDVDQRATDWAVPDELRRAAPAARPRLGEATVPEDHPQTG